MNERITAKHVGRRASARWAYPRDLSQVCAEGQIIGYCDAPQVLIETDGGVQMWWRADLTVLAPESHAEAPGSADENEMAHGDPQDFLRRCDRLEARGLPRGLVDEIRRAGDARVVDDLERQDEDGLTALVRLWESRERLRHGLRCMTDPCRECAAEMRGDA